MHATGQIHLWGDGTLVFNPGECAGTMHGLNAIGILDLTTLTTLTCELLRF
jgi:hypothetical protein